jgi:hypothetical protein
MSHSLYEQAVTLTAQAEEIRHKEATARATKIIEEITPALLESAKDGNYVYSFVLSDEDLESSTNYTVKELSKILETQGFTTKYSWCKNTLNISWRK